jgi:ribonuclease VapC
VSKYVLDASAVLALLNAEPGHERVAAVLADSVISAVNYCEVLGKLIDAGLSEDEARDIVGLLSLEVSPFGADSALRAAALRPVTKNWDYHSVTGAASR